MANTETNYSFEKVNQAIADKTPDANLDAYDNLVALAKSLNKKVWADFDELKGTGIAGLDVKKTELVDKFKEAQILFNGSYDLLDKKDDDIDGICEQELISFAKNLDQTFAKFIREAQGEEGYSFAFRYVEDYVETKDGEMEVFGFKISDAVKFMNKLGISLGWLKAFVPEIAEMEADVAQEWVEKAFTNVVGADIADKHLKIAEVKEILEKRDTEIANPKNTDKKAINYEFIIKQYFDEALKKIGGEANLKKACQNEKLNFKELVKISQSTPDKLAGVNEWKLTLRAFLDGTQTIEDKMKTFFANKKVDEIYNFSQNLDTIPEYNVNQKSAYENAIKTALKAKLDVLVEKITEDGITVKVGGESLTIAVLKNSSTASTSSDTSATEIKKYKLNETEYKTDEDLRKALEEMSTGVVIEKGVENELKNKKITQIVEIYNDLTKIDKYDSKHEAQYQNAIKVFLGKLLKDSVEEVTIIEQDKFTVKVNDVDVEISIENDKYKIGEDEHKDKKALLDALEKIKNKVEITILNDLKQKINKSKGEIIGLIGGKNLTLKIPQDSALDIIRPEWTNGVYIEIDDPWKVDDGISIKFDNGEFIIVEKNGGFDDNYKIEFKNNIVSITENNDG